MLQFPGTTKFKMTTDADGYDEEWNESRTGQMQMLKKSTYNKQFRREASRHWKQLKFSNLILTNPQSQKNNRNTTGEPVLRKTKGTSHPLTS